MAELTWRDVPSEVERLVKSPGERIRLAFGWRRLREKHADVPLSALTKYPTQAAGYYEGPLNSWYGGPRPMATMLAGGALGAAGGYGLGWLGEHLLPSSIIDKDKKRLRRVTAAIGGVLGALPGVVQGYDNLSQGGSILEHWPKESSLLERAHAYLDSCIGTPVVVKQADVSGWAENFQPVVRKDVLNRVIWGDPDLPGQIAAGATGLVEAASQSQGGANLVSPYDIARVAVGMGSGLVSGLIVGKVLGAVSGLSQPAQTTLARTGALTGLLVNVVPLAYGR